ncbi:TonB-dependent receptor [Brevundimonas sp. Root1279]|uniref:TonB-dependent receptor n=1 Tax=Brevundimonas sp. Root1279 TaxID=1736443 RepID=UPI0006F9ED84|nr:TonB-dependent receptor [Brevundimonas sp. Root1279]KQW82407.1 TonB-dependent receptor [Brevundimonas sp. Root1279]
MRVYKRALLPALLASSAIVAPAWAQTAPAPAPAADPDEVEEVIVTGIRASQAQSIDIKRDNAALVDAISAEDIGKLPDVTVADALQRIPGVQIQRSAGEGATVNVRGMPQVVTLMNGEQYLSPGNLGTAQPNLNDVPAQLMSSIVVFKSQDVTNALSGISGTIDLRTRRPFDFDEGSTIAALAEYQTGERTREDDYLLNGLINWRNDRFGVMVAGVLSESNLGNNYSGISGGLFGNNDWGGSADNWIAPHGYDSFQRVVERKRESVNAAFQFDIEDGIRLTGEVFYTHQVEHNRAAGLNISNRWSGLTWTNPTEFEVTGVNGGNGNPWLDVTEYDLDVWWMNSFTVNRTTENESTNFNLELDYDKGGPFTFNVRAIKADASLLSMNGQVQGDLSNWEYGPDRTFTLFRNAADRTRGPFYPAAIASQYPASQFSNGVIGSQGGRYISPNPQGYGADPQLHIDIGGGSLAWSGFDNLLPGGLGGMRPLTDYMSNLDSYTVGAYSSEGNQRNESDLTVFRADGSYEFDNPALGFITRVDAGLRHGAREVEISNFHLFSNFYAGVGDGNQEGCAAQWKAIDVVMDNPQCRSGEFVSNPGYDPLLPLAPTPGNCGTAVNAPTCFQGYTVNRPTLLRENNNTFFMTDYGSITTGLPGVWVADPRDFDDVVAFQERVFGNAFEVIIPGNSYDVDLYEDSAYVNTGIEYGQLSGDIGLRMVHTELRVRQNQTGDTRAYGDTNLDVGDTISSRSYQDWLPSVNLSYDLTDELRLRGAWSKTMIPLDLGNYGGGVTITTADSLGPTPADPTAPPVGIRRVTGATLAGSPDLDPWRASNFDLALEYYLGRETLFNIGVFRLDIDSFVTRATVPQSGSYPDGDGVTRRLVDVNRPVQGEGGQLQGLEVGVKVGLADFIDTPIWSNFGFDGSYTLSDSSQNAKSLAGDDLPFPDNSKHSLNAALWYQDAKLQARVAWNYRTPRLSGTFGSIPIYQDTAQYVDLNVTYDVNDLVAVYFNGSNILGEIEEYYVEFEPGHQQFHSRNQFEPRYSIGVRARF